MPSASLLFNVKLPKTNKSLLTKELKSITKNSYPKKLLFFYYSEFLLRANRNPFYKEALNNADLTAIDGRGLLFAQWSIASDSLFVKIFKRSIKSPSPVPVIIFLTLFPFQLFLNFIYGIITLLFHHNFTAKTQNEIILGRDYVYDLLEIADDKNWKVLIIGGSSAGDKVITKAVSKIFPNLNLISWTRSSTSLLMKDQIPSKFFGSTLNSENINQIFPDLWEARNYIKKTRPDMILVCLGGASGKQEFFLNSLKKDPEISFKIATGLGAAIDHLGGGSQQQLAPRWMVNSGIEWLYRFISNPNRRKRIIDSIFGLWWWLTVEQFSRYGLERKTVINILSNKSGEFLLVKRRGLLPGDIGYSFIQGGIKNSESISFAGNREIQEETGLKIENLKNTHRTILGQVENHSISFIRFVLGSCKYNRSKHYLNFALYQGFDKPKTNWENHSCLWVPAEKVQETLSIEKRSDFLIAQKYQNSK
jgi:exopolysaccharide biosynthesis WecB/TagA/CpsF family protein